MDELLLLSLHRQHGDELTEFFQGFVSSQSIEETLDNVLEELTGHVPDQPTLRRYIENLRCLFEEEPCLTYPVDRCFLGLKEVYQGASR
ncbi:MAG: hypothetical protein A2600_11715 [Candidatus Lambdaproteobacteria bacterium RIFOXYD1_FULL_56_27]|uniref:CdiI immunity protein domain-containing protein n=1 Tax=Candidatus Lambdaproteobacteria bacterium RIFOXYD2_FULL_56_26 TaxID=1817773 RepID=A0A1F6GXG9_9PROT|nr:MAG: hypothetical protein A2426_12050 [Candidatus Lambdaproteobacteria bacterium RIFOXYC1_FULL_56_13]OGH02769.1 MAG: hypothetical protein A2557_02835 [Candidatus Lambdaproteobacteria bacterium RIFOXYD2_FULL_56_26]OGH08011.1 MAG: hypothetical protein A2600_11715 [Candidatus Lambdaproteobacteria bacterium RIFOXYD1_FULL_56_27]